MSAAVSPPEPGRGAGGGRLAGWGRRVLALCAFTVVVLRGLLRDRTALFFMLLLPVGVIVVIGAAFGNADRVAVILVRPEARTAATPVSQAIEDELRAAPGLRVRVVADADAARDEVRRADAAAALLLPPDLDQGVLAGHPVEATLLIDPTSAEGATARLALPGVVTRATLPFAAAAEAAGQIDGDPDGGVAAMADRLAEMPPPLVVVALDAGDARSAPAGEATAPAEAERFSQSSLIAAQNLVLFVFVNAMASAGLIVAARRDGVLRRAMSTRTGMPAVLTGLGIGWLVLALVQSAVVLTAGRLLFDVDWGDPAAAAALVLAFAGVGCGAGLLVGAVGADPDRVGSITPVIGIVLGALGGCMVPPEIFPPAMTAVAHATPQYWAVTGWQRVLYDGVGLAGIAGNLAVLAAVAVALTALAGVLLHRSLTRG
ncbi:MAG: ABC transporter permease [Frankia sp.]|nr:ABC transporter permease [Frankia sp.]